MNGAEFLRRLQAYSKRNALSWHFVAARGKGSHGTAFVEGRFTTVKDRKKEIGKGLLKAMLRDLGIDPSEF